MKMSLSPTGRINPSTETTERELRTLIRMGSTDTKLFVAALFVVPIYLFILHLSPLSGQNAGMIKDNISGDVSTDSHEQPGWDNFESRYFTVYFETGVDLDTVKRRLRKRIYFFGLNTPYDMSVKEEIGYRLDALLNQAKEILDMHPAMPRLKIKMFRDECVLFAEYNKMTGKEGEPKAFYVQAHGTIYTSEDTMTDSVISHEIAHAIIDNYFSRIPSSKVSEVLASYVDMHISE